MGCNPPPPKVVPPPAPQPASEEQVKTVQADLQKMFPGATVGHVSGISGTLAAVFLGSPPPAIHPGESIQFADANGVGIANGQVISVDTTSPEYPMVVADFEPLPDGRAPIVGDMAIYIPPKQ